MSMKDILQRLDALNEGAVTPVGVKHGLNAQQKSVKQMPALFKSKDISPVLSGPYDKKHPAQGYLVGANEGAGDATGFGVEVGDDGAEETPDGVSPDTQTFLNEEQDNPVERAILHRIMMQHTGLLGKYGPELVMAAAADVADFVGDVEEIGSSDVSGWVQQVIRLLADSPLSEAKTTEDVVSSVKKKLGDYLADLSKEIKADSDLKDKIPQDIDKISPAVKTITTDDGKEIKIHGNEDDGFRITIKNKEMKSRFDNLDEAVLACEMFMNRKRSANVVQEVQPTLNNNDYVEEKK